LGVEQGISITCPSILTCPRSWLTVTARIQNFKWWGGLAIQPVTIPNKRSRPSYLYSGRQKWKRFDVPLIKINYICWFESPLLLFFVGASPRVIYLTIDDDESFYIINFNPPI